MRLRPLRLALATLLVGSGFGIMTPSQASSAGYIAGSCDAVTIQVENNALTTPNGGLCVITEYNGVALASNAVQRASIEITAPDVTLQCSGNAVRGFKELTPVTFTVHGNSDDIFQVSMVLDSADGGQSFNPTATALIKGLNFAGVGTFTRSGSGNCAGGDATWTLGHISFEDPTL